MSGYTFMIDKLTFHDGCEYVPSKVTIVIGPNNAGKSRMLKEIRPELLGNYEQDIGNGTTLPRVILKEISCRLPKSIKRS